MAAENKPAVNGKSAVVAKPADQSQLIDVSSLTKVATNDAGLLPQPKSPNFKLALVEVSVPGQRMGGSDKVSNGHRYDTIPLANGMIKNNMSCQLINYVSKEHAKFFEVLGKFDGVICRVNPGHIQAAGGDQKLFDRAMTQLASGTPVWPTPEVMTKMGAKDALCQIKSTEFGLEDTFGYYSPEQFKAGFKKAIAFQPRVVKQNRGSAGEGIWIVKLKSGNYCPAFGEMLCDDSARLVLTEANDNHVEEHTVGEFIEFCINGRSDKSGRWMSSGTGKYFAGGKEAGGQMVDQRFLPRISEGEVRFFMVGSQLYKIEHYVYVGGVSGETKTTVHEPTDPKYRALREQLESKVSYLMRLLGLQTNQLPLLWAADFIPLDKHPISHVIGEFNCSCLGITSFLDARGKDLSVVSQENKKQGQKMCDFIGEQALQMLLKGRGGDVACAGGCAIS